MPDNNDSDGRSRDDRAGPDRAGHDRAGPDAALEAQLQRYRGLGQPVTCRADFADRVMTAVAPETRAIGSGPVRSIGDGLSRIFLRVAPLAAAAALVLATMNVVQSRTTEQPLLDRMLGLRAVTLEAAYTLDLDVESTGGSAQ